MFGWIHSDDRDSGFTLIELILAVAILATVATLVFAAFSSTFMTLEALREEGGRYHQARISLALIADELLSGYLQPDHPWTGRNGEIGGQPADLLAFVSAGHRRHRANVPETDVFRVLYAREGSRLVRLSTRNLYGVSAAAVDQSELVQEVSGFNLRYYDPALEAWVDEWNGRTRKALPAAVMIELTLTNVRNESQTFTEWVTIPPLS